MRRYVTPTSLTLNRMICQPKERLRRQYHLLYLTDFSRIAKNDYASRPESNNSSEIQQEVVFKPRNESLRYRGICRRQWVKYGSNCFFLETTPCNSNIPSSCTG